MKTPRLSVVVPCYNVERFVEKCLRSLLEQSYRNVEILCVEDASDDGTREILERMAREDARIRVLYHERNEGLFRARLTGAAEAVGKYIAFVDSDDYVSCDWFRPLVQRAEETGADMVLGNIVEVDENGWRHYANIPRRLPEAIRTLQGDAVIRTFLEQRGCLYYWHVMWNKVYRRSFFAQCVPHFAKLEGHLVMTEDIAFSSVLYSYARRVELSDSDCYFYCRHAAASTSLSQPPEKVVKNLNDVIRVFRFFRTILQERGIYTAYEADYLAFRAKYFRIWCNNVTAAGLDGDKKVTETLLRGFGEEKLSFCTQYEFHCNSLNTAWDDRLEQIKREILDPANAVISFDVFDTLLKRPVWVPQDILYFVQYEARDVLEGCEENRFFKMRRHAEQKCRDMDRARNELSEDVTLHEIYRTMGELYALPRETVEALQRTEIQVEQAFLRARLAGKGLYELATFLEKPVVLVSDMYLSAECLRTMLRNCGYEDAAKLYVSSDYRRLKYTGNLFRIVLRDLRESYGVSPERVLHIGDTWQNDVIVPRGLGMKAVFLPKAIDVFTGNVGDIFNGNCTSFLKENLSTQFDTRRIAGQLSVRTLYAIIANDMFDDPFRPFQAESRFNGDPYFMGYFALGPYVLGLAKWASEIARTESYEKIVFLARDGFLVKQVFDQIVRHVGAATASDYVHATRKAVLPYVTDAEWKLYLADNFVNIFSPDYTFRKFLRLFTPIARPLTPALEREYARHGVDLEEPIGDPQKFVRFVRLFNRLSFDKARAAQAKETARAYYAPKFAGRCAAFDIGYSGRIQRALSDLCGHPIDALFVHDNGFSTQSMAASGGFRVYSYYDFNPLATDILRETFLSEPGPSCVGLNKTEAGVFPVLEQARADYSRDFAIRLMQRGALDYAESFLRSFGKYLDFLALRNTETGFLFEYFCTQISEFDRYVFVNHTIEDSVYSGFDGLSLVYRWNENLHEIAGANAGPPEESNTEEAILPPGKTMDEALQGNPRWKKAVFYWLFDRETLRRKLRERRARREGQRKIQ